MTRQEALEIKEITDQCIGTIPSSLVDRIWHYYIVHIEPTKNRQSRPCTCSGKYWTGYLFSLKDKVTDTLRETEEAVNTEGNL